MDSLYVIVLDLYVDLDPISKFWNLHDLLTNMVGFINQIQKRYTYTNVNSEKHLGASETTKRHNRNPPQNHTFPHLRVLFLGYGRSLVCFGWHCKSETPPCLSRMKLKIDPQLWWLK